MDKIIKRDLSSQIEKQIGKGKLIVIYGARQVGKTTLLQSIFGTDIPHDEILWLNGDDRDTQDFFQLESANGYAPVVNRYKTIIIDEAQRIPNIGLRLKILQDNFGDKIQFVATGSSSFDLSNKINEPLTGRKWTYWLPSLSVHELANHFGPITEKTSLEQRLIYGSYPAIVANPSHSEQLIAELASDNLYRDVLTFGEIIKTDKLQRILKALALQIGSQVSMTELASLVELDRKTVDKYISLLEQSFIIFRLPSFGRNLRNELKFSEKIYFYDVGIRNAVINNFVPLDSRTDAGALFENYVISELKKKYQKDNIYFWRNNHGQEIDFVLEKGGKLTGYEVKFSEKKLAKVPGVFEREYHPQDFVVINRENYLEILG